MEAGEGPRVARMKPESHGSTSSPRQQYKASRASSTRKLKTPASTKVTRPKGIGSGNKSHSTVTLSFGRRKEQENPMSRMLEVLFPKSESFSSRKSPPVWSQEVSRKSRGSQRSASTQLNSFSEPDPPRTSRLARGETAETPSLLASHHKARTTAERGKPLVNLDPREVTEFEVLSKSTSAEEDSGRGRPYDGRRWQTASELELESCQEGPWSFCAAMPGDSSQNGAQRSSVRRANPLPPSKTISELGTRAQFQWSSLLLSRSIGRAKVLPRQGSRSQDSPGRGAKSRRDRAFPVEPHSQRNFSGHKSAPVERPRTRTKSANKRQRETGIPLKQSAWSWGPAFLPSGEEEIKLGRSLTEGRPATSLKSRKQQRMHKVGGSGVGVFCERQGGPTRTATEHDARSEGADSDMEGAFSTSTNQLMDWRMQVRKRHTRGRELLIEEGDSGLENRRRLTTGSSKWGDRFTYQTATGMSRRVGPTQATPRRGLVRSLTDGAERLRSGRGLGWIGFGEAGKASDHPSISAGLDGRRITRSTTTHKDGKLPHTRTTSQSDQREEQLLNGEEDRLTVQDPMDRTLNISKREEVPPEEIQGLVDGIIRGAEEGQREALKKLRVLTRDPGVVLSLTALPNGLPALVTALGLEDRQMQEHATTCLLNASLDKRTRHRLCQAGVLQSLPHILESGSARVKANAAAALSCLLETEEQKVELGRSSAVDTLVQLVRENPSIPPEDEDEDLPPGVPEDQRQALSETMEASDLSARKDALKALMKLADSSVRSQLVQRGVIELAVRLLAEGDEDSEDISTAMLAKLVRVEEGRARALQHKAVPALVEVVELGCHVAKEYATSALHTLAFSSAEGSEAVKQELSLPLLGLLEEIGSEETRIKAVQLSVLLGGEV